MGFHLNHIINAILFYVNSLVTKTSYDSSCLCDANHYFRAAFPGLSPRASRSLNVLNHASRTLPRLPYTNLKKSRTDKKTGYWAYVIETACK